MSASAGPAPFPQLLVDAFHAEPDTPAFEHRGRPVSRAEVLERTARCLTGLRDAGLRTGDGVALATGVTPDGFAALLAALLLGCRVVGLRAGLTDRQLVDILGDDGSGDSWSQVRAVVADAEAATPGLRAAAGPLPLLDLERRLLAAAPATELRARGRAEDAALITLTSGSTGSPKGCAHTYGTLARHWAWAGPARWTPVTRQLASGYRRFLLFGTLTSAVMLEHLALSLHSGGTAVIPEPPFSFPEVWSSHRATACLCTVPRLFQVLDHLRGAPSRADAVKTLEVLLVAGSPLPPHRLDEAVSVLGPAVHQGYGQTETGMLTLLTPADLARHGSAVLDSVGRPLPDVEVTVRDAQGAPVPTGAQGEVWVRSAGALSGYWRDPEQSAEILHDGALRTRDIGALGADGFLRLTGRARDVVIINAVLHHPGAVESVLAAAPEVDQAYVVGVPDPRTGESAHAFLVAAAGAEPDPETLRAAVREALGEADVPSSFTLLDAVPLTSVGKPDRRALQARAAAAVDSGSAERG